MSNKTIAKFYTFVISAGFIAGFISACSMQSSKAGLPAAGSRYESPRITGTIKSPDITESSGIAASRCQNDVLWTHNDSGGGPFIFAINKSGDSLGTWKVANAQNIDWEDIAANKGPDGKCFLYIGDIGDNKAKRAEHAVYRLREPVVGPSTSNSNREDPLMTEPAEVMRFTYPDHIQDAETLTVHPVTGDIYVITKRISGPAGVYRLHPDFESGATAKIEKVADISVPAIPNGFLTGGDISPDGRSVVLCDYTQGYELILPDLASKFDEIWQQEPERVELGKRVAGEAVCYGMDGTSIFATSERKNSPIIEVKMHK